MKNIQLSDNHRRSLSSSIYLIEKMIVELEHDLNYPNDTVMSKISIETEDIDPEHFKQIIPELKDYIIFLYHKYNLTPKTLRFNQLLNARRAKMWEILCNTTSKGMKGYGKFPAEHIVEYDSDIEKLIGLVQRL